MTECVVWTKGVNGDGYGQVRVGPSMHKVHVLEYERHHGPVRGGNHVHHKCENKRCYNIDHLELLTPSDHHRLHAEKMTEEQAIYAMARMLAGETQKSVAAHFGVTQVCMSQLWTGKTWGHLFE